MAAKIITTKLFTKKCFGAINFVITTEESLYKANSLACFFAKGDPPVAATLQRKSSGGVIFVVITKIITKKCSKELFCNHFGQDGTLRGVAERNCGNYRSGFYRLRWLAFLCEKRDSEIGHLPGGFTCEFGVGSRGVEEERKHAELKL